MLRARVEFKDPYETYPEFLALPHTPWVETESRADKLVRLIMEQANKKPSKPLSDGNIKRLHSFCVPLECLMN